MFAMKIVLCLEKQCLPRTIICSHSTSSQVWSGTWQLGTEPLYSSTPFSLAIRSYIDTKTTTYWHDILTATIPAIGSKLHTKTTQLGGNAHRKRSCAWHAVRHTQTTHEEELCLACSQTHTDNPRRGAVLGMQSDTHSDSLASGGGDTQRTDPRHDDDGAWCSVM